MFWKSFYEDDIQPEIQVAPMGLMETYAYFPTFPLPLTWLSQLKDGSKNITEGGPDEKPSSQKKKKKKKKIKAPPFYMKTIPSPP